MLYNLIYCVNKITDASQESSEMSWEWKYISREKRQRLKCNFCSKKLYGVLRAKVHLLRAHGIDEDEFEVNRSNLLWQYFTEEVKYSPKCKICNKVLIEGYLEIRLRLHLKVLHPPILNKLVHTISTSLYSHFQVDSKLYKAICIICGVPINVFKIVKIEAHLTIHGVNKETRNFIKNEIFESINDSLAKVSNVDSASH